MKTSHLALIKLYAHGLFNDSVKGSDCIKSIRIFISSLYHSYTFTLRTYISTSSLPVNPGSSAETDSRLDDKILPLRRNPEVRRIRTETCDFVK